MEIQKSNNLPPTLQRLSQTELVRTLQAANFKAVSESLPTKVKDALGQPPICEVEKVAGRGAVVRYIEFELIRLTALISVGGNLNDAQVQFIATQMVEMFPNESLADFKLCFERGCIGQYGEIYRMDGIVLRQWMEKYLDEKYQLVEAEVKKEKQSEQNADYTGQGYEKFKKYAEELRGGMGKVPGMEEKEIKKHGQEKPVRKTITDGYKYFPVRGVQILAMTQEHAEELAEKMLKAGMLEEVTEEPQKNKSNNF